MFANNHYINAGTTEIYRYGKKAVEKVRKCMTPNKEGFYSIFVDEDRYWAIGTNQGKYGEYAKFGDDFFSVNSAGYMWAKVGTPKEKAFLDALESMIAYMNKLNSERLAALTDDSEDE